MKKVLLFLLLSLLPVSVWADSNWKAVMRYDKQTAKTDLSNRLQKYAQQSSHAKAQTTTTPSTKEQTAFAKSLVKELKHIGASKVQLSKTGIVTAEIPATTSQNMPVIALIAHLDMPPQAQAQTLQHHAKYTGGDILLNKDTNIALTEQNSAQLLHAHGHDLITSQGVSAYGVENKAGLSIVMTLADYLLGHTAISHGLIKIVLLPDAPSLQGANALDISALGANYALLLKGNDQGEIATSNFSGRSFTVVLEGNRDIPLGQAIYSNFVDNLLMASDFQTLLPRHFRPETTAGSQGYITVTDIVTQGNRSTITGQIRAFNDTDLQQLSNQVTKAFNTVKAIYPRHTKAQLDFADQFKNVQNQISPAFIQMVGNALQQEEILSKQISVRDNTDFAVLTHRGLPTIGLFTGVFHAGQPLEYADADIMESSLRGLITLLTSDWTSLSPVK